MVDRSEKARALRIQRIAMMLNEGLTNPAAAVDALISELKIGEKQPHLWEGLHVAASNGKEQELAAAYRALTGGRGFKQLKPEVQAEVLIHAAQFFQGMLGDIETAERFLMSALAAVPDQAEAFNRLEKKYDAISDKRKLLELYGTVSQKPPKPAGELAGKAVNMLVPLTAKMPLSDEACRALVGLVPAGPSLLDALEGHCRKTGRAKLAYALVEQAVASGSLPETSAVEWRRKLIDGYVDELDTPEKALPHVEALLRRDGSDPTARAAVARMMSMREVRDRVTDLMQEVRRDSRKD
jgi:hypothetical protein